MIVGMIVEGKYDSAALPLFCDNELELAATYQRIFPDLDATGGDEFVDGGWTQLIERIINEAKYGLKSRFDSGLFDDEPPLDCLIIHLDLDIARLFLEKYRNVNLDTSSELNSVVHFHGEFLNFLTSIDDEAPLNKIILACPAPCTDGWILLGLGGNWVWNERSSETKKKLRQTANGCHKSPEKYRDYASSAAGNADTISRTSASYARFSADLKDLI